LGTLNKPENRSKLSQTVQAALQHLWLEGVATMIAGSPEHGLPVDKQ
jgi:hypothetical protein